MKERKIYLDIAKAFAIICVIIGHTYYNSNNSTVILIKCFIYSFHMPLFFLISGYLAKKIDLAELLSKNARTLLLPYYITAICVVLYNVYFKTGNMYSLLQWGKAIVAGLPCANLPGWEGIPSLGAIWFLQALFVAHCEVKLLYNSKYPYRSLSVIFLIALVSVIESKYYWLPLNINTGLVAACYLAIGCFLRDFINMDDVFRSKLTVFCASIIWIVFFSVSYFTLHPYYFAYLQFPLGGLEIIGSICGVYVVLCIAKLVEKNFTSRIELISIIGQSTLYILCVHLFELDTFSTNIHPRFCRLLFRLCFDIFFGVIIQCSVRKIKLSESIHSILKTRDR